jgi:hypothetical protein
VNRLKAAERDDDAGASNDDPAVPVHRREKVAQPRLQQRSFRPLRLLLARFTLQMQMRSLGALLALLCLVTACGSGTQGIRVTLTAQNHDPHPSESPSWQWWYCVKVTTAAGKSVASRIDFGILSGRSPVQAAGTIWLKKGYDHWCADIGGEGNILDALPRGKKLVFQAVVSADGVTVKRNWPIVVPAGHIYTVEEVRAAFAAQGLRWSVKGRPDGRTTQLRFWHGTRSSWRFWPTSRVFGVGLNWATSRARCPLIITSPKERMLKPGGARQSERLSSVLSLASARDSQRGSAGWASVGMTLSAERD